MIIYEKCHILLLTKAYLYVCRYSKEFSLIRLIRCNISNMIYACNLIFKVHKRQDAKYFRRTKSILLYTIFDSAYSKFVCTYHIHVTLVLDILWNSGQKCRLDNANCCPALHNLEELCISKATDSSKISAEADIILRSDFRMTK